MTQVKLQTLSMPIGRPGIREPIVRAVERIIERHRMGSAHTAIVLPPRTGKSDVIRCVAIECSETREAQFCLALTPWVNLADQLIATKQVDEMLKRYVCPTTPQMSYARVQDFSDTFHETSSIMHLWTATIGLANSQKDRIARAVKRSLEYGTPAARPIIFIDEGHLLSRTSNTGNSWGEMAAYLASVGAHIVLLTGTPYRSDDEAIPGFQVIDTDPQDVEWTTIKPKEPGIVTVFSWAGQEVRRRLVADYEWTLSDSFKHGYLTRIVFMPVDQQVTKDDGETIMLSELCASDARKVIRRVVESDVMCRLLVDSALTDMARRRGRKPNSAMLVVTGSDNDQGDGAANFIARKYKAVIEERWPAYMKGEGRVEIATMAIDDEDRKAGTARKRIAEFIRDDGQIDVLIVKAMGQVGLDCARLKTVIVADTVRTLTASIQRNLRVATQWDRESSGTVIFPADILSMETADFIRSQDPRHGMQIKINPSLTGQEDVITEEDPPHDFDLGDAGIEEVEHSKDLNSIDADLLDKVWAILAKFPELGSPYTHVELGKMIADGVIVVKAEWLSEKHVPESINVGAVCQNLCLEISELAKKAASKRHGYFDDKEAWRKAVEKIQFEGKRACGITGKISQCYDVAKLHALKSWTERLLAASA